MVERTSCGKWQIWLHQSYLVCVVNLLEVSNLNISFQRCHDPANGRKCKHVQFKKRGPDHLETLEIMFEKAHVNGASALTPGVLSDSSDDEAVVEEKIDDIGEMQLAALKRKNDKKRKKDQLIIEEKEEKSPFLRLFKKTCSNIGTSAEKIASSVEASSAPPHINQVPSVKEALVMVKECGVKEGTDIMPTAMFLIMKPEFREGFSLLETNDGRLSHPDF